MALDFDGSTDYARVSSSVVNLNTGTFAGWFAPDIDDQTNTPFYFFDTDTARHAFYHGNPGGGAEIEMYIDGRWTDFDAAAWTPGEWTHFAFVYDKGSDTRKCYINGVSQTASFTTGTWGSTSLGTNFHIGERINSTEKLDGDIGEIGVWSVQLSDPEITALSKGYSPLLVRPTSLNGYWPFIRDVGTPYKGIYAATITGSPPVSSHPRIIYPNRGQIQSFVIPAVAGEGKIEWPSFMSRGFMNPRFSG